MNNYSYILAAFSSCCLISSANHSGSRTLMFGPLETEAKVENPEHLQLVVGLYCYAEVACNDCFKVKDFRKLFVAAWFIYYSTVLRVEHNATPGQSSFLL